MSGVVRAVVVGFSRYHLQQRQSTSFERHAGPMGKVSFLAIDINPVHKDKWLFSVK